MTSGISAVVCCRDRAWQLRLALARLGEVLRSGDELIVVDSASTDLEVAVVAEASGARVLRAGRPGLGHARNLGWQAATRPVVAFTDDDCRPEPGWTAAYEAAMAAEPEVGILFGRVRAADAEAALSVYDEDQPGRFRAGPPEVVDRFGHGANFAVRATALRQVGGFADDLGAGTRHRSGEDIDLALRVLLAGWTGGFEPAAAVTHEQWRDRVAGLRVMFGYGVGAGVVARRLGNRLPGLTRHQLARAGTETWRAVRAGNEYVAAAALARLAGTAIGVLRRC